MAVVRGVQCDILVLFCPDKKVKILGLKKKLSIISINNKGQQSKLMEQYVSLYN